jgi:hypothetical protein
MRSAKIMRENLNFHGIKPFLIIPGLTVSDRWRSFLFSGEDSYMVAKLPI